jgi:MFS family permease
MAETLERQYGTFSQHALSQSSDEMAIGGEAAATSADAAIPLRRTSSTHEKALREMRENNDEDEIGGSGRPITPASVEGAQAGVKRLEAIASTWSKTSLYVAYLGIGLLAFATSLESQTTTNLTVYATSSFSAHALVSTVLVVQGVVLSVVKPPMSKIADVFGRFEAFSFSVLIFVIGYVQQAAANNVKTYAAAQIFYSAGQTGLQILVQIFIADTSDLLNRALIVTLPDVPFLVNVWVGPALADAILSNLTWRWGYAIWALVLPVAFLPLAITLWINQRKAAKRGLLPPSSFEGKTRWQIATSLWYELDVFGLLLICVGFSLVLIPLSIGSRSSWQSPGVLVMLTIGALCVVGFPFWERSKKLAPHPFFPRSFFRNRTALSGLAFAFFYFCKYSRTDSRTVMLT